MSLLKECGGTPPSKLKKRLAEFDPAMTFEGRTSPLVCRLPLDRFCACDLHRPSSASAPHVHITAIASTLTLTAKNASSKTPAMGLFYRQRNLGPCRRQRSSGHPPDSNTRGSNWWNLQANGLFNRYNSRELGQAKLVSL